MRCAIRRLACLAAAVVSSALIVLSCPATPTDAYISGVEQGAPQDPDSLEQQAVRLQKAGSYAEASSAARQLVSVLEGNPDSPAWKLGDARRLLSTNQMMAALPADQQRELMEASRLSTEMMQHTREGNFARAAELAQRLLETRRKILGEPHPEIAMSLNNLAGFRMEVGDYAGAEPIYREALAMWRRIAGEEHPDVARGLNNLAVLLSYRAEYDAAIRLYREALAVRRKLLGPDHADVAKSLHSLGAVMTEKGEYANAETLLREALAIRRRSLGAKHPAVASTLTSLSYLCRKEGDGAGAKAYAREALQLRREIHGDEHPGVARSLYDLAQVLSGHRDYTGAERLFREALDMRLRLLGEDHPNVATTYSSLGLTLIEAGKLEEAESILRQSIAVYRRRTEESPGLATSLHNLGILNDRRREHEVAEQYYRESMTIRRRFFGDDHVSVGRSLYRLAQSAQAQGEYASSESLLIEAGEIYETARLRVGAGFTRATFQRSPYCMLAASRLELDRSVEAWPATEKGLARTLGDLLLASGGKDELRGRTFPLARVQAALDERTALLGWLHVLMGGDKWADWAYVVRNTGPVRWIRLQTNQPEEGETALERAAVLRESLAKAGSWPFRVTSVEQVRRDGQALWMSWLAPMALDLQGVEHLVVIPQGPLLGVPLEALVDGDGNDLGERFTISYAPSATLYTWLIEQKSMGEPTVARNALLVGDPPFAPVQEGDRDSSGPMALATRGSFLDSDVLQGALARDEAALASLPRLPRTRQEVERVAAVIPNATILLGAQASEQALVRLARTGELEAFDIIHLATHALVDDERPEQSALILSQVGLPNPLDAAMAGTWLYDGLLRVDEILSGWELGADLVTLSGCQTALGRQAAGEGYLGFAHAFLQAGARSLLVSLWRVEDEATALLMERFYANLAAGERRADALREAKRWLRDYTDATGEQPFRHPAYWSAFMLIGDPL